MKLMVWGTSSGVGKTVLTAAICRYLSKKGIDAVPFKASNLSSFYGLSSDGKRMGAGQCLQSLACSKAPHTDMNPILFVPSDNGILTLIHGETMTERTGIEHLRDVAGRSFDRLSEKHEAVICEGSGSPAELNMTDRDIANLWIVREKKIPAVLVADIEYGGCFASLFGTWELLPDDIRPMVKGFIINRFRGDPSLLNEGIRTIEEKTKMKCLGIVRYRHFELPEEDPLSGKTGNTSDEDALRALDDVIESDDIDLQGIEIIAGSL